MKTYARLDGDRVAELLDAASDPAPRFHPSLVWLDVTGLTVVIGSTRTPTGFAPPPASPPDHALTAFVQLQAEIDALKTRLAALSPR